MWRIGTDTGGTFTDLVAISDSGQVKVMKTSSTPPHFERGVIRALRETGVPMEEIDNIQHGTTATTNALLTRTGARTALLTTRGFRDVLEIRDGSRGEYYDINWNAPPPLVARPDRICVSGRMDFAGIEIEAADEHELEMAALALRARGIDAVAVCFIHSYANESHESLAAQVLRRVLPDAFVCTSAEVLPEPPEFPRTSTTVANAYVGPVLSTYLTRLEQAISAEGIRGALTIMHSGGGTMTPGHALRLPIRTATSGPAAGVIAAAALISDLGRHFAVSLDMGGTSADISVIVDGRPVTRSEQIIEWGLPVAFPSIDVTPIGAGGGSIAWVDDAGAPHVGPQSAGANPGPACYGRGGDLPTTTDANLVLGRLRSQSLLGGQMTLDSAQAESAIERHFAKPLSMPVEAAAEGIVRIANEHMANGIRRATIQRGLDPREFSLIAFGGAGPMHAAEVASLLQIPEVVIPPHPGATSALGLVMADSRHDFVQSHIVNFDDLAATALDNIFAELERQAAQALATEGFQASHTKVERLVEIRYVGQVRTLTLPYLDHADGEVDVASLRRRFHAAYEEEFKYAVPDLAIETKCLRVVATGLRQRPRLRAPEVPPDLEAALVDRRPVHFGGQVFETSFYNRDRLGAGVQLMGPAVVEQYDATTVIPPAVEATVDPAGNLLLSMPTGTNL